MAFLGVAAGILVVVLLVGAGFYVQSVADERARLSQVIGRVLAPALENVKASGEYKMDRLVQRLVTEDPAIAYLRVLDRTHAPIASAGADGAEVCRRDVAVGTRAGRAGPDARLVEEWELDGRPVTEVAVALRGGYRQEWTGVMRFGVWGEPAIAVLLRAGLILGGLLLVLLAAAYPLVLRLGRRLGAPIEALAQDFEGVMRHAPLHIVIEDAGGRIVQASDAFRADFGLGPQDRPLTVDVVPGASRVLAGAAHVEERIPIGGEERVFVTSRFPVALSDDGLTVRSGVISAEVTAWRRDQAQRDQLVAAAESTHELIAIAQADRGVVYANPAFCARTGFTPHEVSGRSPLSFFAAAAGGIDEDLSEAVAGAGSWRGRVAARRRDKTTFQCDLIVFPILDRGGEVHARVWTARDVSRQVDLEAMLRRAQKMEAVGRLAGGVAHDFNNLLTVINGAAELIDLDALDADSREGVEMIADAGRRAAGLTRQLLAFSRRQVLDIRELDLNAVVEGTLSMLRRVIGTDIELVFEGAEELWPTRGDVGQIEQVLVNLAINARDAMPKGGCLTMTTENGELVGVVGPDGATVAPGPYVILTVSDTGEGMTDEVLDHIFEPFFTTKGTGKGTGLGLAMVHGIVRQSGGHLWVFSRPGLGTTFRIGFPKSEDRVAEVDPAPWRPAPREGRGERVLLVEDDGAVRVVVAQMLERAGYDARVAADGREALTMLAEGDVRPDLIICDLVMPHMGGLELAGWVREGAPSQRLLFLSGYSADAGELAREFPGVELVHKPPSVPTLLAAVRRALEGDPAVAGGPAR